MRKRNIRDCLDFRHGEDSKVRLPLMKSIQRIMIRTEILRNASISNRLLEHATKGHAVNYAGLDSKTDDAAGVLVHHDQELKIDVVPPRFIRAHDVDSYSHSPANTARATNAKDGGGSNHITQTIDER